MMKPQCPKCEGTSFEGYAMRPDGFNYNLAAIKCKYCNTVISFIDIGVSDGVRLIGKDLEEIKRKIK